MGRPWWYDSYWEKNRPPRRRSCSPGRRLWVWLGLLAVSAFFGFAQTGFHFSGASWIRRSVDFLCGALSAAVFARVILSWVLTGGHNTLVRLLDDVTEPFLRPLRRVIPMIGRFDVSPVAAILILSIVPYVVSLMLSALT